MKVRLAYLLMILVFASFVSDKPAYKIYNAKGEASDYGKMMADVLTADVVFFGEEHNNAISHWLELEVTIDAFKARGAQVILGAEMFEADNQAAVDDYLSGKIDEKELKKNARLWPNFPTDYKPLLDFAKDNKLKFIATNIPRKYASYVNKKGYEALDTISAEQKKFIAPLPIKYDPELECYKSIVAKMPHMPGMGKVRENLPKAQNAKDATMAYFINKNYVKGNLFIHYNGRYHSDNFSSILWHLKQLNPDLKIVTISTATQIDINTLEKENTNIANYIICVPENVTRTYIQ